MSTTPLWHKEGTTIDEAAMAFMSKDDVFLDRHLFRYDIRATEAHVRGLGRIDLMEDADVERVAEALHDLDARFQSGAFVLDDRFEDGHSAIEADLTEHLGELGKRIHLGRSRNDQVAVALRLFMLDHLREVRALATDAQQTAEYLAKTHAGTPMPGYTHLQRAMPSSVDLWMGSFAEGFRDVAHLAKLTGEWIDSSPLGTAAGYGVPLPLDREGVAQELGFDRVQKIPCRCKPPGAATNSKCSAWAGKRCRKFAGWRGTWCCSARKSLRLSHWGPATARGHPSCPTSTTPTWRNCCGGNTPSWAARWPS